MFTYSKQTEVGRVLPKSKIYAHAKASGALQRKFVNQVDKIIWKNKLAPETTNLSAHGDLNEIQVFELHLKAPDIDEEVLRAIDRTIRHPIAFQLKHGSKTRFVMAAKRTNQADADKWVIDAYFWTGWIADTELQLLPLPLALNLYALYEQMLRAHLPLQPRDGETLQEQIDRAAEIQRLKREIARLQAKMNTERQFNRKVALNRDLRELQQSIGHLSR